jgi:NAD(P) transhydrogenase subunit alpha
VKIAVRRETAAGERRVAATPDTVRSLLKAGLEVVVEKGAGDSAGYPDTDFAGAGATVVPALDLGTVEVLAHVRPLEPDVAAALPSGSITVGLASPASELATVAALRDAGVTAFALELVPRISRAQSMDALTSQALVAGYRCVLEAAIRYPRFYPLSMTAAGTVPPAKVLVLGAGVAGLQAIATAKRLGAKVSAYDVRTASAEEVASMGGTFITLDLAAADAAGGYAKELDADRAARQQELLTPYVSESDVIITTAQIPGRPAPQLLTRAMLAGMRAGSVIVDLAAESGGNVEGSIPGQDVQVGVGSGSVTLVGMANAASTMPYDASRLYARNVANLIELMTKDGAVVPDQSDEIVASTCLVAGGVVLHEPTAAALAELSTRAGGKN